MPKYLNTDETRIKRVLSSIYLLQHEQETLELTANSEYKSLNQHLIKKILDLEQFVWSFIGTCSNSSSTKQLYTRKFITYVRVYLQLVLKKRKRGDSD